MIKRYYWEEQANTPRLHIDGQTDLFEHLELVRLISVDLWLGRPGYASPFKEVQ